MVSDQTDEQEMEIDLSHLKDLHKNVQNGFDKEKNSFVVRDNVINGNLDTVNETDSNGGIQSLKKMNKQVPKGGQRTSIYRQVLTKDIAK